MSVQDKTPGVRRRRVAYDDIAPDGSEIRFLVGPAEAATKAGLCEVTLPAGEVSQPVWHHTVEEIWYVLDGDGEVWRSQPDQTDAVPVKVSPGDALVIPTGSYFQFAASKTAPLRFLCYTSPPWSGASDAKPAPRGGLGKPTR